MSVGNLSQREQLAVELKRIRREARITQMALSTISGVGTTKIKDIERAAPLPKPDTLRLLADGAATDGAGRRDETKAAEYLDRLMRAAGYVIQNAPEPAEVPDDTLKRQIEEAFGTNARQIEDFLIQAQSFDRSDKEFILRVFSWMRSCIPDGAAVRQRHLMFPS